MHITKFSVALVIHNPKNESEVLAVQRPPDDDLLPSVWGLPAASLKGNELPEEIVKRIGREKLNTEVKPVSMVGIKRVDRGDYELILMDIKTELVGKEPNVKEGQSQGTTYVDQKWTSDFSIFILGARKGSVCNRIFLESQEIDWNK